MPQTGPQSDSNLTDITEEPSAAEQSGIDLDILATLVNRAYDRAKRWAGALLILQFFLFVGGIVAILWPKLTLSYPWMALPLALVGAEISRRASYYKSLAETAKRQHEYAAGFGFKPSGGQLADLRQSLQGELSPETDELLKKGITYASSKPKGPARALENLIESSWFTKHLAAKCGYWVTATFICTVVIAGSLLFWLAESAAGAESTVAAAKGIAATLIFLISVGSIRSLVAYFKLSQKAKDIDSQALTLLLNGAPSIFDTQRLLTEYQVARSSAPLIPTWMWKLNRDSLNKDWNLKSPTNAA